MTMTKFDKENLADILYGENKEQRFSWLNAHVLRFLNIAIGKANIELLAQLYKIWPEQMVAIYEYWGWPQVEIDAQIARFGVIDLNKKILEEFG